MMKYQVNSVFGKNGKEIEKEFDTLAEARKYFQEQQEKVKETPFSNCAIYCTPEKKVSVCIFSYWHAKHPDQGFQIMQNTVVLDKEFEQNERMAKEYPTKKYYQLSVLDKYDIICTVQEFFDTKE